MQNGKLLSGTSTCFPVKDIGLYHCARNSFLFLQGLCQPGKASFISEMGETSWVLEKELCQLKAGFGQGTITPCAGRMGSRAVPWRGVHLSPGGEMPLAYRMQQGLCTSRNSLLG